MADSLLETPWTTFVRGTVMFDPNDPKTRATIEQAMELFNCSYEEVVAQFQEASQDEIWLNARYQVNVRRQPAPRELKGLQPDLVHLSIKRLDKGTNVPWRDKQRIKNELVGEEFEAIELFPAESRVVDTANQYHLWCFVMPGYRFPIGWQQRHVLDGESLGNSVQAALDKLPVETGWKKLTEYCHPEPDEFCLFRSKNDADRFTSKAVGHYGDDVVLGDYEEWMHFPT